MKVLKTSRVIYAFQDWWIIKNKIYVCGHQIECADNIDLVKN